MIAAHLIVLSVWFGLWLVFFGWGEIACRVARCNRQDSTSLLLNPWIGVACVVALLQIWNFAAPIDGWPLAVVSAVGLAGVAAFGRQHLTELVALRRTRPAAVVVTLCGILWIANRSLNTQQYVDHGLYYMNAIRWATDYRIVPGLANLHERFGFNNSNFLLHAMLEVDGWRGYSGHLVNGFLAALSIPIIVNGFSKVLNRTGREQQLGWFAVALAMIIVVSVVDRRVTSACADFAAAMLVTVAAWRMLAIALSDTESEGRPLRYNLFAIALLATTAVTFKTSVIFFAGLALIALLAGIYQIERRRRPSPISATAKLLFPLIPWVLLLFVPWLIRGYILSGYPLFPSTVAGAPVDWKLPQEAAEVVRTDIVGYARSYYGNLGLGYQPGWGWVRPWLVQVALLRAPTEVVVPAAISFLCLVLLAWRKWRPPVDDGDSAPSQLAIWLLALVYTGSVVMWFLSAPSPRLGSFAMWGLAGTLLVLASREVPRDLVSRHRKLVIAGLSLLLILPIVDEALRVEIRYRKNPNQPEFGHHFYYFHPFVLPTWSGRFPPIPVAHLEDEKSNYGVLVHLGKKDAAGKREQVWDSPLPAAQILNPDLELRVPGDLQSGFRTGPATAPAAQAAATNPAG